MREYIIIKDDELQAGNVGCTVDAVRHCGCVDRAVMVEGDKEMLAVFSPILRIPICEKVICCYRSSLSRLQDDDNRETPTEIIKELTDGVR